MARKLSPDARRISTIIISFPFLVATSYILYQRLYQGIEQKSIPKLPKIPERPREEFPTSK